MNTWISISNLILTVVGQGISLEYVMGSHLIHLIQMKELKTITTCVPFCMKQSYNFLVFPQLYIGVMPDSDPAYHREKVKLIVPSFRPKINQTIKQG